MPPRPALSRIAPQPRAPVPPAAPSAPTGWAQLIGTEHLLRRPVEPQLQPALHVVGELEEPAQGQGTGLEGADGRPVIGRFQLAQHRVEILLDDGGEILPQHPELTDRGRGNHPTPRPLAVWPTALSVMPRPICRSACSAEAGAGACAPPVPGRCMG